MGDGRGARLWMNHTNKNVAEVKSRTQAPWHRARGNNYTHALNMQFTRDPPMGGKNQGGWTEIYKTGILADFTIVGL